MSKQILMVTGDAAEALEVMVPYYRCLEEGFKITIAAPNKKEVQTVVHDRQPDVMEISTERLAYRVQAHALVSEVDPEEYDALILPGGRAPEYIRNKPEVISVVGHFLDANKPIATICHGALLLVAPELRDKIAGRNLTCVRSCMFDVQSAGANFVEEQVYSEGNIVSAQTWRDLPGFMREFFKLLQK